MIRHPGQEQLHRLTVKTLDQVFVMRVREGLGCPAIGQVHATWHNLVLSRGVPGTTSNATPRTRWRCR